MYALQVRDRLALMQALVCALCGDAWLSLEGDLSRGKADLLAIRGAVEQETSQLRKNTFAVSHGPHDFLVVPLEVDTVETIAHSILPRLGVARHVWHIGIEKGGELQFIAYDNFDSASLLSQAIGEDLLQTLVQNRILRGYSSHE